MATILSTCRVPEPGLWLGLLRVLLLVLAWSWPARRSGIFIYNFFFFYFWQDLCCEKSHIKKKKEWNISIYIYIYIYENHLIQFYTQCLCLRMVVGGGGVRGLPCKSFCFSPKLYGIPVPSMLHALQCRHCRCSFLSCSCSVLVPFFFRK